MYWGMDNIVIFRNIEGNFDKIEAFDSQNRPLAFQYTGQSNGTRLIEQWARGLIILRIYAENEVHHFKVLK